MRDCDAHCLQVTVDLGQRPDGQRRRLLSGGGSPLLVSSCSVQLLYAAS